MGAFQKDPGSKMLEVPEAISQADDQPIQGLDQLHRTDQLGVFGQDLLPLGSLFFRQVLGILEHDIPAVFQQLTGSWLFLAEVP